MKKLHLSLCILLVGLILSPKIQAQSQNKYQILISIASSQNIAEQKDGITFFRDLFGTKECRYNNATNTYEISSIHYYSEIELKKKIELQGIFNNVTVKVSKMIINQNNANL